MISSFTSLALLTKAASNESMGYGIVCESSEFRDFFLNELARNNLSEVYPCQKYDKDHCVPSLSAGKVKKAINIPLQDRKHQRLNSSNTLTYGPLRTNENKKYQRKEIMETEFVNNELSTDGLRVVGVISHENVAYHRSPPTNGVVEKRNRTLMEAALRTQPFCTIKRPQNHQVSLLQRNKVDDLFQWFDDDEVVPKTPVVRYLRFMFLGCPAGNPKWQWFTLHDSYPSKVDPQLGENLFTHQTLLPDTSESDVETLFDHVYSHVFDNHQCFLETDS
ncbi:hypothetical protein Tco_0985852 [Tanacetum coccineum]